MNQKKIKVLVAEDSIRVNHALYDIPNLDQFIEVLGVAASGQEAFEKAVELAPDIITLDLSPNESDAQYAVKMIMKHCPTPVVWVSVIDPSFVESVKRAVTTAQSVKSSFAAIRYPNSPGEHGMPGRRPSLDYSAKKMEYGEAEANLF